MGARKRSTVDDDSVEINLSPKIDCIFIQLLFFIVTTVFVEETGLQVNKPDAGGESLEDSENIMLLIGADNKGTYNGREIAVGSIQPRVRQLLATFDTDTETPVIIRAHSTSSHGTFVTVWDGVIAAGAEKVSFNTAR